MATYAMLQNGSKGDDVKKMQTALINAGYSVGSAGADGIFGNDTASAVKKYQQANGLSVDGIAGDQTLGKLYAGATAPATAPATPVQSQAPATPKAEAKPAEQPKSEYKPYQESETVKQAQALLQQQMSQKPGAYQSTWQDQLDGILDKIQNREKFTYDMNADALYQLHKDNFVTQGKQASMDAMGQAAALTGGYGNSYAQTVGQQTYQGYLQNLNDIVPELYQLAMDQYNREGDALKEQYALLADREALDYGRYRDQMADWQTERDYVTGRYDAERDYDYGKYADDRDYAYQLDRDKKADEKWQAEFDEAKRQYDQQYAMAQAELSGGSSGGSSSGSSGSSNGYTGSNSDGDNSNNGGLTKSQIAQLQRALKIDDDGVVGPQTLGAIGDMSLKQAYDKYVGSNAQKNYTASAKEDIIQTQGDSAKPTTYSQAVEYMKMRGVPAGTASGIRSQTDWMRNKNSGTRSEEFLAYKTYEEYLAAVSEFMIEKYGK